MWHNACTYLPKPYPPDEAGRVMTAEEFEARQEYTDLFLKKKKKRRKKGEEQERRKRGWETKHGK